MNKLSVVIFIGETSIDHQENSDQYHRSSVFVNGKSEMKDVLNSTDYSHSLE